MPPTLQQLSELPIPIPLSYDWRKVSSYKYTKDMGLRQWAWEFLRRNPQYQAEWLKVAKHAVGLGEFKKKSVFHHESIVPPINNKNALINWGWNQYIDPRQEKPRYGGYHPAYGRVVYGQKWRELPEYDYDRVIAEIPSFGIKSMALGVFDLSKEIEGQIKSVHEHLLHLQEFYKIKKDIIKSHETSYITYIRLLDALNSGTPRAQIIDMLYTTDNASAEIDSEETYKRHKRRSLHLSKEGYRKWL